MKLVVVLSITEYRERVAKMLHEAGITRFSTVQITGYKKMKSNPAMNWFGRGSAGEKTNSVLLFSFAPEEIADHVVESINQCNDEHPGRYPVHAFVLTVDNFSKFL